jgi:uracil-DNA glycosylase family protein
MGSPVEDRPGAGQWVPERPGLRSLVAAVQECRGCELWRDATQAVMGRGPRSARLLLLGEQPGDHEDREGEPFVGPAGRVLDRVLEEAGIDPTATFRTNVVKHFRWSGTRGKQRLHKSPGRAHIRACGPWLVAELDVVRPEGVVLLGGTAGTAVHGTGFRVGESRGRLLDWPDGGPLAGAGHPPAWVLATTHPSAVLRSEDRAAALAGLVADLRVAAQQLDSVG